MDPERFSHLPGSWGVPEALTVLFAFKDLLCVCGEVLGEIADLNLEMQTLWIFNLIIESCRCTQSGQESTGDSRAPLIGSRAVSSSSALTQVPPAAWW